MVVFSLFCLSVLLTGIYSVKFSLQQVKKTEGLINKVKFLMFICAVLVFVIGSFELLKYAQVGFNFYNGDFKTIDKTISRFYK